MNEWTARTELLLGDDAVNRLNKSCVAVFGIGGVGSYTVEALARGGVGKLVLVDSDTVALSNINRQLIASVDTVGMNKVEVACQRVLSINPDIHVRAIKLFYSEQTASEVDLSDVDYIVDAIDSVSSKLFLTETAEKKSIPIISCMGAGNKLNPTMFEVDDIYHTSVCPLAKIMRSELRKRGIKRLKVVYSKEKPIAVQNTLSEEEKKETSRRSIPGSVSFVPSVAGLIIAGEVIKDLIK